MISNQKEHGLGPLDNGVNPSTRNVISQQTRANKQPADQSVLGSTEELINADLNQAEEEIDNEEEYPDNNDEYSNQEPSIVSHDDDLTNITTVGGGMSQLASKLKKQKSVVNETHDLRVLVNRIFAKRGGWVVKNLAMDFSDGFLF